MGSAAATAWPDDAVEVGSVVGAWGVKGWLRVKPFSTQPRALLAGGGWFLKPGQRLRAAGAAPLPQSITVVRARPHGDGIVAQAEEIGDRDAAEALVGSRIFISRQGFPATDVDEFYWVDLIGLEVFNRQHQRLGTVAGLIDTGPHSVLRVAPDAAPAQPALDERLIPFVAAYIDSVSLAERRIVADWGLDY